MRMPAVARQQPARRGDAAVDPNPADRFVGSLTSLCMPQFYAPLLARKQAPLNAKGASPGATVPPLKQPEPPRTFARLTALSYPPPSAARQHSTLPTRTVHNEPRVTSATAQTPPLAPPPPPSFPPSPPARTSLAGASDQNGGRESGRSRPRRGRQEPLSRAGAGSPAGNNGGSGRRLKTSSVSPYGEESGGGK